MSEENNTSLNVKRLPKMAAVKHSTPVEQSTCSKSMLFLASTLNSSTYPPLLPNSMFQLSPPFEDYSDAQNLQDLVQKKLSGLSYHNEEPSNSSQFVFPRRRLSTIIGSEESADALHQTIPFAMTLRKRSGSYREHHNKGQMAKTEQAPSGREAAIFKGSVTNRKRKRDKNLVEKRIRKWELRQLKNIEEATTHELTVEDFSI